MKFPKLIEFVLTQLPVAFCFSHGRESSYFYKSSSSNNFDFKSMKDFIVFGDSYTQTGTNYETMESPGWTSSYGKNWNMYLSEDFNKMNMWNFASGGAYIDPSLVVPYSKDPIPMTGQYQLFLNNMGKDKKFDDWSSYSTLFGIWFGINDIGYRYKWSEEEGHEYIESLLTSMFNITTGMYENGARNFLFLNVPPVDESPFYVNQTANTFKTPGIKYYNESLNKFAKEFNEKFKNTNVFVYDTNTEFRYVAENKEEYGIVDTTTVCPNLDFWEKKGCHEPKQYYWTNELHPTFVVHESVARDISTFLNDNSEEETCWSEKLGYPCCEGIISVLEDESGKWGAENGNWCGILESKAAVTCWSEAQGYPCCDPVKCNKVYFVDENGGEWGVENADWCGINKNNRC